jgi:hypothetical protein
MNKRRTNNPNGRAGKLHKRKSKYIGVSYHNASMSWRFAVTGNHGLRTYGNGYATELECARAYDRQAVKYGAPTNFLKAVHSPVAVLATP